MAQSMDAQGSAVPKQRRRRLVMSFEMVRLDRASSEPLYQQLYRQIRELHRLAATRGRFPVIHARSRANRHLGPPSFFLLYQGSVGSGIRLWICGLVASAN